LRAIRLEEEKISKEIFSHTVMGRQSFGQGILEKLKRDLVIG
jgi:hypothetical protein